MKYILTVALSLAHVFVLTFLILTSGNISRAEQISPVNEPVPLPTTYESPIKNFEEAKNRINQLDNDISNQGAGAKGGIIIYGSKKEVALREAQIKRFLRLRKYDLSRYEFFRGNSIPGIKWSLVLIPSDYPMKDLQQCINLKIYEQGNYIPEFYNCLNNRSLTK